MTVRSEKYSNAAKAYEDAKIPYDFKREIDDIVGFVVGQEWTPALGLLRASNREIHIGFVEGAHADTGYFLNHNGFYTARKDEDKTVTELLVFDSSSATPERVLEIAKAFRNLHPSSGRGPFDGFIFGELDKIAEACPK